MGAYYVIVNVAIQTGPNLELADGDLYASADAWSAYRWMRAHEPVFRDRNGLAAAATHQALRPANFVSGLEATPVTFTPTSTGASACTSASM